ncbi:MAG: hypothetical protein FH749_05630 [Firmicutes bacterium]|nr:hypothetical protein [Bacillota bacterium]
MRKASDILGMPVLSLEDGKQIGYIMELLFDLDRRRLHALQLGSGGILDRTRLLVADKLKEIGRDVLVIDGPHQVISGREAGSIREGLHSMEKLKQKTVYTKSGNRLGTVQDIVLSGLDIEALELSEGLLYELFHDPIQVPLSGPVVFGEGIMVGDYLQPGSEGKEELETPPGER